MKFEHLYSRAQKEGMELCKNNQKQIPALDLKKFVELLNNADLPEMTLVTEAMILRKPEVERYVDKLINFFKDKSSDFIVKFYQLLTPKENIKDVRGSIIFIYGTYKSTARAEFGAKLYQEQNLPIIISDNKESAEYKRVLLKNGVSPKDIFEEKQARNFAENAYYSVKLALYNRLALNKITLVTASIVALRGLLTTQIFLSPESQIYSAPVEYDLSSFNDPTSPENWYKNKLGIQTFLSEIVKLYIMKEEGLLRDMY